MAFKDLAVKRLVPGGLGTASTAHLKLSYQYDGEGHRTQMTVPINTGSMTYSTMNYSYDAMERATGMTDAASGSAYVSGVQYGPSNELLQMSYTATAGASQVNETLTYNSLLQLTGISASGGGLGTVNLTYTYTAGQNNGKMASATNGVSGEQVVYQYDTLNRLIQAQTASNPNVPQWGQGFVYDGFGNLYQKNVTKGSAPSMQYTVNAATNQLGGLGYDAPGTPRRRRAGEV